MIRKIIRAIRRAKQAAYVNTLQKQLDRFEAELVQADGAERLQLVERISRKRDAVARARVQLAALALALGLIPAGGCAHAKQAPTEAIETAVVVVEAVLEVCKSK